MRYKFVFLLSVPLQVDSLNRYMITASLDGTLKFWHFHHAECQHVVVMADVVAAPPSVRAVGAVGAAPARSIGVSHVMYHPDNELVAVACDDLVVRLFSMFSPFSPPFSPLFLLFFSLILLALRLFWLFGVLFAHCLCKRCLFL